MNSKATNADRNLALFLQQGEDIEHDIPSLRSVGPRKSLRENAAESSSARYRGSKRNSQGPLLNPRNMQYRVHTQGDPSEDGMDA